jgi:hypothetical protein
VITDLAQGLKERSRADRPKQDSSPVNFGQVYDLQREVLAFVALIGTVSEVEAARPAGVPG